MNKSVKLNRESFIDITGQQPQNTGGDETILQFGEGNFLRAFCDWMVHRANLSGCYDGRIVVVQPRNRPQGTVAKLQSQSCLYNVLVRGRSQGSIIDELETVQSISRGINPYTQWQAFLDLAKQPSLKFVLSNTTEAGVAYAETPQPANECPASFPAKLTHLLHLRWRHFEGAAEAGMIILPCELIDKNADTLKEIVLKHCEDWSLEAEFTAWLNEHCKFCNTLVDRIVPGKPADEDGQLANRCGCEDELLVSCEPYHIWAIEAADDVSSQLPLEKSPGVHLVWTNDLHPIRYRKVRILNGGHMVMVPVGLLAGCELVSEALDDELVGGFVRRTLEDEVLPTLEMDACEAKAYLADTLDRFANPFIKHKLHTISLNSTSKFRVRLLQTLLEYVQKNSKLPDRMCAVFAAVIAIYRGSSFSEDGLLACDHGSVKRLMNDDSAALKTWASYWSDFAADGDTAALCKKVLGNSDWWGRDLTEIDGLTEKTSGYLQIILDSGMRKLLEQLND